MVRITCNRLHKVGTSLPGAKIVMCVTIVSAYIVYIPLVIGPDHVKGCI